MSLSIPYVLNSEESTFKGGPSANRAGNGEDSPEDFYGIMSGISGLAGDVATTLNSLTKINGKGGTPKQVATITPPNPEKPPYLMYAGVALVAALAFWFFTKGK